MKMFTVISFLFIGFLAGPCPGFQETIHAYADLLGDAHYVSMKFEVVTKGKSAKWNDASHMIIVWHDGQVLYLDQDFERLVAKKFTVLVNHEAQTLDIVEYAVSQNKIDVLAEMDKWLTQSEGTYSVDCKKHGNRLIYLFSPKIESPIKSAKYEFIGEERLLTQLSQIYRADFSNIDEVIMKFTDYDFVSKTHISRFNLNHYFSRDDIMAGQVEKGRYSGYNIIFNEIK